MCMCSIGGGDWSEVEAAKATVAAAATAWYIDIYVKLLSLWYHMYIRNFSTSSSIYVAICCTTIASRPMRVNQLTNQLSCVFLFAGSYSIEFLHRWMANDETRQFSCIIAFSVGAAAVAVIAQIKKTIYLLSTYMAVVGLQFFFFEPMNVVANWKTILKMNSCIERCSNVCVRMRMCWLHVNWLLITPNWTQCMKSKNGKTNCGSHEKNNEAKKKTKLKPIELPHTSKINENMISQPPLPITTTIIILIINLPSLRLSLNTIHTLWNIYALCCARTNK